MRVHCFCRITPLLLAVAVCGLGIYHAVSAQNYDVEREGFETFHTLSGGFEFFIDTNTMQNNNDGTLIFNVVGYSPDDKENGGYSRSGQNRIDCRKGIYNPSFGYETHDADGDVAYQRPAGYSPTMTLRYDGGALYNRLRQLCYDHSGLEEDDFQWLDKFPR